MVPQLVQRFVTSSSFMNGSENSADKEKNSEPDNSDHSNDGKNSILCKIDNKPELNIITKAWISMT
jgi:hypothetical protein